MEALALSERPARDKCSSLLRTFENYGHKFFITLGPGANVIKLFTPVVYDFEHLSLTSFSKPCVTSTVASSKHL
jgi:hypothetical protein